MKTLVCHKSTAEDDAEHSNYTPQINISKITNDTITMDSSGIIDADGATVHTNQQRQSAIQRLQGTLYVPHATLPVNDYNNPSMWLGAYPWLFPHGKGGPEIERKVPVSLKAYVKHLLNLKDRKFCLDQSFKFHVFNILQKRDVSLHTSLIIRRPGFHSTASQINTITHDTLVKLAEAVEKGSTTFQQSNLKSLMKNLNSIGSHIRGPPYQKASYRRVIFGLMIHLGTPPLRITISPAAVHSPIFLKIAGYEFILTDIPSAVERAKLVAEGPVAAAKYFNLLIDSFVKYILGYDQESCGIFGHSSAYYGCIEEQGTGNLHIHMLVWLHGFKSLSQIIDQISDINFQNNLINYPEI